MEDFDILYAEEGIINSNVAAVIKKAKRIATFFHQSPKACNTLKEECSKRALHYYRLVQCVSTRWNSAYFMLRRIYNCFDCINLVLVILGTDIEILTSADRVIMHDVLKCLTPFADATEELSGEKYVTISLIIVSVGLLLDQLKDVYKELKSEPGRNLLETLMKESEKRLLQYESRIVRM